MSISMPADEYAQALRLGQKEYRERVMAGKNPYPAVLDELLPSGFEQIEEVGLIDIPSERIIGTKSAGRISAFSASFRPLLEADSEFGHKWIALCRAHLDDTGIHEPIECFEYLGNFYVQEGNKRVSVLRHFDAPMIPGYVRRILPSPDDNDPRIRAYYEFLEFQKITGLYNVQFRRPGDYARLLTLLGKKSDEVWTRETRSTFSSCFHTFRRSFEKLYTQGDDVWAEEALLLWLKLYPYRELVEMTESQLDKSLSSLWADVRASSEKAVTVKTKAEDESKAGLLAKLFSATEHIKVAFVHQMSGADSPWVQGHEEGRAHLEAVFGDRITARSYFGAASSEEADRLIELAVTEGAQVVFTTAPPLSRATLRAAVNYPKVRFLNCSVDQPYTSIRTYYGRIYEAKFITGAIAGAIARNGRIGYIASYPIFGVPASINAFALGAQLTNPRAKIDLRWSCCEENPQATFFDEGIQVISNREGTGQNLPDFCNYGTYELDDYGNLASLATPVLVWGKFYEFVIRSILSGGWKQEKGAATALNYWLGLDSGVIDIKLSDRVPEGIRSLSQILRQGIMNGSIDPFLRRIVDQEGQLRSDGTHPFTPSQILHMDWLCHNVTGSIPEFDRILPRSRKMVRELGIYRDRLEEEAPHEDPDRI